jgi:zinc transport system substrate-binding protein
MIIMKNKTLLFIGILILTLFVVGCSNVSQEQKYEELNVVVSILPQKTFVQAVGGNLVNVKELIPPGGSPATYEPRPSDLALVENADIYFRVGHIPFEKSHIDKFAELNPDMKIVDTSINVQLRYFGEHEEHTYEHDEVESEEHEEEHNHEGVDPHIWLSPMQVKKQVDVIAQTLSQEDPANAEIYNKNAEKFKKELDDLHSEIESQLGELKTDKLLVFHPAWGYFADEYGLEQIAIEQSGKEPTAQELQYIIETAKEENIKVIFIQSQFNKDIAESIAQEVGAVVVSIDPLSEDYINNLRNVAITISESLK